MAQAARMVEVHLEGILAQLPHGLTTAFMENINSLLSAVEHLARDYPAAEYMTPMLYFVAVKLSHPCH